MSYIEQGVTDILSFLISDGSSETGMKPQGKFQASQQYGSPVRCSEFRMLKAT